MSFNTLGYTDIKAAILRDIANNLNGAYVGDDGDYAVRASGEAAAIEGLYAHQQYIYRQIFPDTADLDNLIVHAQDHGINRKPAVPASGVATFTGTSGSVVSVGTEVKTADGSGFLTTSAGTISIGGSSITCTITAEAAGSAGNYAVNTALILTSPPSGINATAVISTATTGGADIESQSALLSRLLFRLQNPPQGGSLADYQVWATDVPGCGYAYIYGQRWAPNSVDIVILDQNGALPTTPLINSVQAAIDAVRPVGASNSVVFGPTAVPVNITGTLTRSGVLLADVLPLINSSLTAYFATLRPGSSVIYNNLVRLILDIAGITDVALSAPTINVATTVSSSLMQMPTLGTVSLT